jgi:flagellum-specific peptidoglycan hydrolase FlgJ
MTPQQKVFLPPLCKACLEWETTIDIPFKRELSIVTVAQAALETGWGTDALSPPPVNNWGGIKHHISKWPGYSKKTREVIQGANATETDTFQTYPTIADFIADHAAILLRYQCVRNAMGIGLIPLCEALGPWTPEDRKSTTPQHSNYSTDPHYGNTLMEIIVGLGMTDPHKIEEYAA